MKILLIVDKFGGKIPTGVISYRIAEELIALGNEVVILTAYNQGNDWDLSEIHRNRKTKHLLPARIREFISNLTQKNVSSYRWRTNMIKLAKSVLEDYTADVIYARSTPITVCEIAAQLSYTTGIPSLMHFTDPVPAPPEWDNNVLYRRRMILTMNRILPFAKKVSFGNASMLDYEQSIVEYPFKAKAFVSTDPVPSSELFYSHPQTKEELRFVYLGSLYGSRNPQPLFDALSKIDKSGISIRLDIYDINRVNTQLPSFAHFVGRTNDVKTALLSANVLIDLDGDDKTPVFISSKIKEYLCCGRPILSITPDNSPSHQMTKGLKTVFHTCNEVESIEKVIRSIISTAFQEEDFKERNELIFKHSPKSVAKQVYEELQSMID